MFSTLIFTNFFFFFNVTQDLQKNIHFFPNIHINIYYNLIFSTLLVCANYK